jgi:hypothetical protein
MNVILLSEPTRNGFTRWWLEDLDTGEVVQECYTSPTLSDKEAQEALQDAAAAWGATLHEDKGETTLSACWDAWALAERTAYHFANILNITIGRN